MQERQRLQFSNIPIKTVTGHQVLQGIRNYTGLPWPKIGLLFNREPSSIRHALAGLERQIQTSCPHGIEVAHLLNAWELADNKLSGGDQPS